MLPPLDCHRAQTARLEALARFLANTAPAIGQASPTGQAEGDADLAVEAWRARDDAVLAAFRAVAQIAANS